MPYEYATYNYEPIDGVEVDQIVNIASSGGSEEERSRFRRTNPPVLWSTAAIYAVQLPKNG